MTSAFGWKCSFQGSDGLFANQLFEFQITSGLTTIVGPNGSGKSRLLKHLSNVMIGICPAGRSVRYLAAGRAAPLEKSRIKETGSHGHNTEAYVGNQAWQPRGSESITGDILRLMERKDLLLKVQCRLEQLFGRKVILEWSQNGVMVSFASKFSARPYSATGEATGLIQLMCIMAALYDDDTSALLIDEPEVGLHPQLQSFLLSEIMNVCGDCLVDNDKKIVVIATHSPFMLSIPKVSDIASVYFFNRYDELPSRLTSENPIAKKIENRGLLARISDVSKSAFFAQSTLLVEGPSDRIITHAIARRLNIPLSVGGVEIVPVVGKGELPLSVEVFDALGKKVVVVTDLDTFVDGSEIVDCIRKTTIADIEAQSQGHANFRDVYKHVRDDALRLIDSRWAEISTLAERHPYWTNRDQGANRTQQEQDKILQNARRRAGVAILLNLDPASSETLHNDWKHIATRLVAVLNLMEKAGCFVLRKGTIESYYSNNTGSRKPSAAADEADLIKNMGADNVRHSYKEIVTALNISCYILAVDEVSALRAIIGSCASRILLQMSKSTTSQEMERLIADNGYASLLSFENVSSETELAIKINMVSSMFKVDGLPLILSKNDSLSRIEQIIKPVKTQT